MTNQPTQAAGLEERLRRTKTEYRIDSAFGGAISFASDETREVLINPDGPEAADFIATLRAERDAMAETLELLADWPIKENATAVTAAIMRQVAQRALGRETVSQAALDQAAAWAESDEGRAALRPAPVDDAMVELVARAICCPNGYCQAEEGTPPYRCAAMDEEREATAALAVMQARLAQARSDDQSECICPKCGIAAYC